MDFSWYAKRLASMGPREIAGRVSDRAKQERWRRSLPDPPEQRSADVAAIAAPTGAFLEPKSEAALQSLLTAANDLLDGRWQMFGRQRSDVLATVDYHWDFVNERRAPETSFFASINHRDEEAVGNVKFLWELARHHHLTVLATAYALTGDERFAERTIEEISHFNRTNPFPQGIHWTSGIEIGIRIASWSMIRILLREYPNVSDSFEASTDFVTALGRHQQWIAAFTSHGSSANNHLIAELAGQYSAATVFPMFAESERWGAEAAARLVDEFSQQTLPDGHNCELASDYHLLVLELLMLPGLLLHEGASRHAVSIRATMSRALDALASMVDVTLKPPRFGDSDDAFGLLLDPPQSSGRVADLFSFGSWFVGAAEWWPASSTGWVRSDVLKQLFQGSAQPHRSTEPTKTFHHAGFSVVRSLHENDELVVFFDHGPLGYLSTAAHGHADALSIDVRVNGVEILADPGTYCYHGERPWRDYFRSTFAHNTVALDGKSQSEIGGPFLWTRRAVAEVMKPLQNSGDNSSITAQHDGYLDSHGLVHQRTLTAATNGSRVFIEDRFLGMGADVPAVVSFHLGPTIDLAQVADRSFRLEWTDRHNRKSAILTIDEALTADAHHGSEGHSPAGWYSPVFGTRVPTHTLTASGHVSSETRLITTIDFPAELSSPSPDMKREEQ